jgi:phosphate/phosphite/phosphonate ABC transporter binding protein
MMTSGEEIRLITYLSPSIPRALFEALADHLQRALGRERVSLEVETRFSGPQRSDQATSSGDEADVAFMCAPSFFWLREQQPPPMELLGVLPVFDDERNQGKPVYFCDVVVRHDSPIQTFSDLQGGSWAYNDARSLSGYYSLLDKLAESDLDESFFHNVFCSGSHLNSIEAILCGEADAAAIDSNVLRSRLRDAPDLQERLRVIESWGPYPIQPVAVRSALDQRLKARLRTAFLTTKDDQHTRQTLERFGLIRFAPVDQEDYTLAAHKNLATILAAR